VTNVVKEGALEDQPCYQAFRESDPESNPQDIRTACEVYPDLLQLFTGIQVAGPRLGPTCVDKGFHAIPPIKATNPTVPACFYDIGDYTCVKDAMAEYYDQTGRTTSTASPGCYRMVEDGFRHIAGDWPVGNINAGVTGNEECNRFGGSRQLFLGPPSPGVP
jgi:hypothetical protein